MKSTESYYRLVIDLYREAIKGDQEMNIKERIYEARRQLSMAITTAHVLNNTDKDLITLKSDLDYLEGCI